MPKVSRVGKFRAAAKGPTQPSNKPSKAVTNDTSIEGNEPLSRGQRKRLAKREQYLKREKMVLSSLRLQRLEEQKGKLDGFDAIRESLPGFTSAPPPDTKSKTEVNPVLTCNTNKSKKSIANTEIRHMGLVLEHPAFKLNPFDAIQQHLRNSLADDAEKLKQQSLKTTKEEELKSAEKRVEKKERLRDVKFSKSKGSKRKRILLSQQKR